MIKASELRIGNWYSNGYLNYTLGTSDFMDHLNYAQVHDGRIDLIFPVSLTPELLKKCGFENRIIKSKISGHFTICRKEVLQNTELEITFSSDSPVDTRVEILFKYQKHTGSRRLHEEYIKRFNNCLTFMHQLQNLYFALTGAELEITL